MRYLLLLCCLFTSSLICAQGSTIDFGNDAYHILNRLEIKTGLQTPYHAGLKPRLRGDAVRFALAIDTSESVQLSSRDRTDLYYLFKDNNEWLLQPENPTTIAGKKNSVNQKVYTDSTDTFYTITSMNPSEAIELDDRYIITRKPILKYFYKTPANLFETNKKAFYFRVNPIVNFRMAKANDDNGTVFLNQRGLAIRAGIDDRIYVQSRILEHQARFGDYVIDRVNLTKALPGQGLYKQYNSEIFDIKNGYDYANGDALLGFNVTNHVGVQFGHGKNFIGDGYRSMMLSDFSNNYLYLKLNWRIWKFHYQNIFAELSAASRRDLPSDGLVPKKYMAAHHLSFNVFPNLNVGFYEAIIFNRENGFEFNYLNPVIFYRTVEHLVGSPDNVLIGANAKWNLFNHVQLYGQIMLDEFKFDELFIERRGWWANKFGIQVGAKYIDVAGIDHLDLQVEMNIARPFTYAHRDSTASNYGHYNQPLAHPLGSNFKEYLAMLRYQPTKKLVFNARAISANYSDDPDGQNFGNNILISTSKRVTDFDNEFGQGINAQQLLIGVDVSYQVWHNVYLELEYFSRNKDSELDELDDTFNYIGGGVRINIAPNRMDF